MVRVGQRRAVAAVTATVILLPHPPTQTPPPPLASHLHHLHLSPPGAGPRFCPPACRGGLPGGAAGPAEAA